MKQLIGHLGSGDIELIEVPRPNPGRGELLVANAYSLVSAGTERMLVAFANASLAGKAWREPQRVRQVLDKARTDGVSSTVEAVQARLEQPIPLGYSACGVVVEVGEDVHEFAVGDRVATNSSHAELGLVPARLAALIPDGVSDRNAAFTTVAAVAMNAFREAEVDVGGVVAIIGLGLIGQIAAHVATAAGCRVIGFDVDGARASALAEGFDDPEVFAARVRARTSDAGADAVLIATNGASRDTTELAAAVTRMRGTVVLVGAGDPTLDRRTFYERELRFVVSHAYGAGRDEHAWESGQVDYPRHRVRWTARRNFEAVLDLMSRGVLDFDDLDAHVVSLDDASGAYTALQAPGAPVATMFEYAARVDGPDLVSLPKSTARGTRSAHRPGVAVFGAGNFANRVLLPILAEVDVDRRLIASRSGLSSVLAGRKFDFEGTTTNLARINDDPNIDVVFIATSHDSHVDLAVSAIEAGKHVWLEKPLAITRSGLARLEAAAGETDKLVMAGFNRRFAPTTQELIEESRGRGPFSMVYTVNAGALPHDHWLNDPLRGGGRIVGEGCHFVDLLRYVADAPIVATSFAALGDGGTLTLRFEDDSIGTVHYFTSGHSSVPKERLEVFGGGRVWHIDNFRTMREAGGSFDPVGALKRLGRAVAPQDKGHADAIRAFLDAVTHGSPSPIPFSESVEVTRAIFDALESGKCFT